MKPIITAIASAFLLIACTKNPPPTITPQPIPVNPDMEYIDLKNASISKGVLKQVDIDKDGVYDLLFSTLWVGDPLYKQDKVQFFIMGPQNTYFLMGPDETTPIYNKPDLIPINNIAPYNWWEISWVKLAEKITPETGPDFWNGEWKNADHKYFGFQVKRANKRYNGWIELSFSTQEEKLIIHRLAISKIAEKDVFAGE